MQITLFLKFDNLILHSDWHVNPTKRIQKQQFTDVEKAYFPLTIMPETHAK